jgi:alpha-beta hydrolase superfamily lysophospholipase
MILREIARLVGCICRLPNCLHFIIIMSLLVSARLAPSATALERKDLFAREADGIRIHVREVRAASGKCEPIVLVHGARVPGVASFDLPVAGGSLAADFAVHGLCVYVVDIRGYGDSTRPPEMREPVEKHPPLVRTVEATRDIDAAVDLARERSGATRVSLFGWATGGQWAGFYATLHPEKLSRLILLNSLYGADAPHPLMGHGSEMEEPAHPGHLNPAIWRLSMLHGRFAAWHLEPKHSLGRQIAVA